MIVQLEYKPFYTIKELILQSGHIGFFSKGVPHGGDQNWEITPLFVFGKKISLQIIFDDRLRRKQALLRYKKANLTKWPYWLFFKGGTPRL